MSAGPGRFITVEGLEGAGKSSCLELLRERLSAAGHPPVMTREPGGTPLSEAVRGLLLDHAYAGMAPRTEALLVFAARAEHVEKVIRPAVARGEWVVSDRFTDASFAYQGGGRELGDEAIEVLEQWTQQGLKPDLTILLDVPVAVGLQRAADRGEPDRFEAEQLEFFERARAAYLRRAAAEPDRVRVINAGQPIEAVHTELRSVIDDMLRENE